MKARLLVMALFVSGVTCSPGGSTSSAPVPIPVRAAPAEIASVPIEIEAIGTVEPSTSAQIKPRVTGLITRVLFEDGEEVSEGDPLYTIERRPFEVALREAQAKLEQARTQAANAAREAGLYAELAAEGIASKRDAREREATAKAQAAAVAAERANVAARSLDLEYTTIKAPITGRTGAALVREGNLVRANETALVVINRLAPIFVSFAVPERELPELREHMARGELSASAAPPDNPSLSAQGKITFLDNAVDRATGTVRVRGTFPNEERRLWPGQFVRVRVTLTVRRGAIVVAATALQRGQEGPYVFVIGPERIAKMRRVSPGARAPGDRVVIEEGLSAGEVVVNDGHLRVTDGARVVVLDGGVSGAADTAPSRDIP